MPDMPDAKQFMSRALALAARGLGLVEPNPMVGAVIVRAGRELACGWHGRFGGPHAEVEALAAASQAGTDVRGATMYVTLEPCSHHGKTPPCTDALIAAGIARVVAAMADPDPRVCGRGLRRLREAGVDVEVGLCEAAARELLAAYVKLRTLVRPWVICKWAQTADGCLALPPGEGRWVTGEASRRRVHELRSWCDGVCVGIGTLLADDPLLTNRSGAGRRPARVVLDATLRTPPDCRLVRTASDVEPVVVATTHRAAAERDEAADALRRAGVELIELPAAADGRGVDIAALLDELGRRQWTRLLVEGGAAVLRSVVLGGLADELWAFTAARHVGAAARHLPRFDVAQLEGDIALGEPTVERLGEDVLHRYTLSRPAVAGGPAGP